MLLALSLSSGVFLRNINHVRDGNINHVRDGYSNRVQEEATHHVQEEATHHVQEATYLPCAGGYPPTMVYMPYPTTLGIPRTYHTRHVPVPLYTEAGCCRRRAPGL